MFARFSASLGFRLLQQYRHERSWRCCHRKKSAMRRGTDLALLRTEGDPKADFRYKLLRLG